MRIDHVAHNRRTQGDFHRALDGQQPRSRLARKARAGTGTQLLNVQNITHFMTLALLATPAAGLPSRPAAAHARGNALLPLAQAAPGDSYQAVPMGDTLGSAGEAVLLGCIARPRHCSRLLAGGALAVGTHTLMYWLGSRTGQAPANTAHDADPVPVAAPLQQSPPTPAPAPDTPATPDPALLRLPADLEADQDPCESLYAHVNQRWATRTVLPDGHAVWDVPAMLLERSLDVQQRLAEQAAVNDAPNDAQRLVGDLWRSGMDHAHVQREGLRPLRAELAAIDALATPAAIAAHVCELTAKGRNPLFNFAVDVDMDDRSQLIAYAYQGGLGLPDSTDYQRADRRPERHAYQAHIARVLRLSGVTADAAEQQAQAVFALERRLAEASSPWAELTSNVASFYRPMTAAEADALTPNFSWSAQFAALGIAPPARFSLASAPFHQAVSTALGDTDPATWRAYLRFHLLDDASPYLSDAFVQAHHDFHVTVLEGPQPLPSREDRVLTAIEKHAGTAMAELYVAGQFPAQSRARIEQMVEHIRAALKRHLAALPWMDAATREVALERADALRPRIGHPDQWPDWSRLHSEACGYLRNLRRVQAFVQRGEIARIGTPVDPSRWRMTAQSVDAYHDVMSNDMAFAAGLLQPPYFDADADDALNYGAIGAIIGHEMAHAFSAEASQFAPDGRLQSWWTDHDRVRYNALVNRITAQFNAFRVDDHAVDGRLTAAENLADLGGLTIALDALQTLSADQPDPMHDGLSREQRFFISWAVLCRRLHTPQRLQQDLETDPHAPGPARADVTPSNLPAFAQAFQCANGTAMVRSDSQRVLFL